MLNREGPKRIACFLRKMALISILQDIKMDLSRENEKAIGVFVSYSETKQLGWIPKEIISEVERK